jgi:hypothetical protein
MFTTALEGGIGYWSQCEEYHWCKEADPNKIAIAAVNPHVTEVDLDGFYAVLLSAEGDWGVDNAYQPHRADEPIYHGQPGWVECEGRSLRVDIDVMERGVNLLVDNVIAATKSEDPGAPFSRKYLRQFVVQWLTDTEDGDSDADVADMIVQLGLFGELVYA